ncbi:Bax inhibitor-1/YccA family protein [Ilumatobacter nonamiensis]|uniref:Bax inhibitor-1/YccA family protein n=1 Tax=Ilumatobacter nonamiensis TaxID=467093 RepID=UPI00034BAF15|nr:Bax inhibitor-1/YccA family protein [Ilumatobacter nonamiensis]
MSNPFFNEKRMNEDAAGWAAPPAATSTSGAAVAASPQGFPAPTGAPVTDGPISTWKGAMTVNGVISVTAVLFVLLLLSATFGWMSSTDSVTGEVEFPPLAMGGIIVGFIAALVAYRKPNLAKFLGPVYAIAYGYAVGAISAAYESYQDGIVVQAIGATIAVFLVMLVMYRTGIVKVTPGYRKVVVAATVGIMLLYLVSIVMSFFGAEIPFINSPSLLGIGFSVLVCALAAANLALDFDLIEKGVEAKMSKDYEWVAALGLVVTLVWLYLEMLRLLSKLNR